MIGDIARWCWDVLSAPPWAAIGVGIGVLASLVALVGFAYWVAELRRRPEVEFLWKIALSGSVEDLVEWRPEDRPQLSPGTRILVEGSLRNVGDAPTRFAQTNFAVPTSIGCEADPTLTARQTIQVGGHPTAFVAAAFTLTPGDWYMQRFVLTLPEQGQAVRLFFELSDGGLNASGRRWLWSRLVGAGRPDTAYGDPWPPHRPSWHRQWTRVHAQPAGQLWCARGVRTDARDLLVTETSQGGEV